jgi:hypothetical protein
MSVDDENFDLIILGVPASPESILELSGLVDDVMREVPAEIHRQIGYTTMVGTLFLTTAFMEEEPQEWTAGVVLASNSGEDNLFGLMLDEAGQVCFEEPRVQEEDELSEEQISNLEALSLACVDIQLTAEGLTDREKTVLKCLQRISDYLRSNSDKRLQMDKEVTVQEGFVSLGAVVREVLIDKNAPIVRVKDYGIALNPPISNETITISTHEILFGGDEELGEGIMFDEAPPRIQLEYRDEPGGVAHCFTIDQEGDSDMEFYKLNDSYCFSGNKDLLSELALLEDGDDLYEEVPEEAPTFDDNQATQDQIDLLISKMKSAIDLDKSAP